MLIAVSTLQISLHHPTSALDLASDSACTISAPFLLQKMGQEYWCQKHFQEILCTISTYTLRTSAKNPT